MHVACWLSRYVEVTVLLHRLRWLFCAHEERVQVLKASFTHARWSLAKWKVRTCERAVVWLDCLVRARLTCSCSLDSVSSVKKEPSSRRYACGVRRPYAFIVPLTLHNVTWCSRSGASETRKGLERALRFFGNVRGRVSCPFSCDQRWIDWLQGARRSVISTSPDSSRC